MERLDTYLAEQDAAERADALFPAPVALPVALPAPVDYTGGPVWVRVGHRQFVNLLDVQAIRRTWDDGTECPVLVLSSGAEVIIRDQAAARAVWDWAADISEDWTQEF